MARGQNGGDGSMADDNAQAQAASAQQYDWRPRPDPTLLTTQQLRETETALNRTIAERVAGLRELLEQRLTGMDQATLLQAERIDRIIPDSVHGRDVLRGEFTNGDRQLQALIEARLDASDKATELLAATVGKVPTDTDKAVSALRELIEARIDAMDSATQLLAENVRQFPSELDKTSASNREILRGEIRNVQDVAAEKFTAIEGTFASNALALTAALAAQKEAAAEQNKSNTLAIAKSEQATKETIAANAAQTTAGLNSQAATINDLKERLVRIEAGGVGATAQRGETQASLNSRLVAIGVSISIIVVVVNVIFFALSHH